MIRFIVGEFSNSMKPIKRSTFDNFKSAKKFYLKSNAAYVEMFKVVSYEDDMKCRKSIATEKIVI